MVGFIGFGLGFNYPVIEQAVKSRLGMTANQNADLPEDLELSSVQHIYDELRQNFDGDLELQQLMDGAKQGLVSASGDPFTEYLDEQAATEFEQSLKGTFSGIGAQIAIKNNNLVVVAPLPGTPADRAGLQAGDHIAGVDGQDTSQMSLQEAVSKIRGREGTEVELLILRGNGRANAEEVAIKRATIEVPSVRTTIKDGNIAHVELIRFGPDTAGEFQEALESVNSQSVNGIVLDMRNNPGGLLQAAIAVADEFLHEGNIVEVRRGGDDVLDVERATRGGRYTDGKVAVLINAGSASASEIVAGALQDNGRAQVIGEQSFGKGSVQEIEELGDGSLLKVTTSHWYTPNGTSISEAGITPGVKVELTQEDFNNDRDPQLDRALRLLRAN